MKENDNNTVDAKVNEREMLKWQETPRKACDVRAVLEYANLKGVESTELSEEEIAVFEHD